MQSLSLETKWSNKVREKRKHFYWKNWEDGVEINIDNQSKIFIVLDNRY
jgi:hypothetical protein